MEIMDRKRLPKSFRDESGRQICGKTKKKTDQVKEEITKNRLEWRNVKEMVWEDRISWTRLCNKQPAYANTF